MPTLRGGGRAIRPRHRVCTLHECDILGTSSRRVWLGQNQQDILLVLKISQGVTWNGYFLAVSGEDSSLLLYCSLRTEPGGTLPWPMAIRIFLRESPWTKKSVFFFFSFGNYRALCENKGIWILFRKNVTYKQIALENLCLTLSAWVRHRESPTLHCFLAGGPSFFLFCMLSLAAQRQCLLF